MSSIDERVVEMRFRNGQFEKGISATTQSLAQFKKDLDFTGAGKGLEGVGRAARNVDVSHISDGVDKINSKFSLLGVVGATAIAKITSSALTMGAGLVKNVLDPIITGGQRRAQNIEQAKFMLDGLKVAWEDIEPAISYAVDGTAYGLDEAARAASSLVASNVPLEKMGDALRGISGVAAMTNSEYSDIAQVFTTVAGNGRLMASELNRIGQRGLNAAAALAEYLGVSETEVREMTSKGKINFEMFAAAMNHAFGEQATKANETFSGSMANVRAALARIGELPAAGKMEQLRIIFNSLRPVINEVKSALTPLLEAIQRYQILSGKRTASFLDGLDLSWTHTFFRYILLTLNSVMRIFDSLRKVAVEAWREIFPSNGHGMDWLVNLAKGFRDLIKALEPSESALSKIKVALVAVFGAMKTVWTIVTSLWSVFKAGIGVIFQLIGILWDFVKPLFETDEATGDTIETLTDFFEMLQDGIKNGIEPVIEFLNKMRDALIDLRNGGSSGFTWLDNLYNTLRNWSSLAREKIPEFLSKLGDALSNISAGKIITGIRDFFGTLDEGLDIQSSMGKFGEWAANFFGDMKEHFHGFWTFIIPIGQGIGDVLSNIASAVGDFLSGIELQDVLEVANLGLLLYGLIQVDKMLKSLRGVGDSMSGMFQSIGHFFSKDGEIAKHLAAMRTTMRVDNFIKIAAGIAILAGAVWLLAQIPTDRLISAGIALAAIAAGFGLLAWGLTKMAENMTPETAASLKTLSNTLILMAISIGFLAGAMWILGQLSWNEIAKGLTSVMLLMGALIGVSWVLAKNQKGMVAAAFAVNVFSAALIGLAAAVWLFGVMDQDTLIQGGIAVAAALGAMTAAIAIMGSKEYVAGTLRAAFAIAIIVGALYFLAGAIKLYSLFKWEDIESGVNIMAGALLFITGLLFAVERFAGGAIKGAASVAIIVGALIALAYALKMMQGLDAGKANDDAQLLLSTIGVMSLIAMALDKMKSTDGAVAVVILAGALAAVATVFWMMSDLDSDKAQQDAFTLAFAIAALGFVATMLDKLKAKDGAVAVAILAGSLSAVAVVFWIMAGIDTAKALGDALLLVLAIGALAVIATYIDKIKAKDGAVAVAILSGSLLAVALAMKIVGSIDPASQMGSLTALLGLIGGLAMIAVAMGKIDTKWGVAAMVILTAAIWVIAKTLTDLNSVPLDNLWGMVLAISTLVAVIGGVAILVGLIAGKFPLAIVAILALALVIGAVAAVVWAFSELVDSITGLVEMLIQGFVTFTEMAPQFAEAINLVAQAAAENSQHFWSLIGIGIGLGIIGAGAGVAGLGFMLLGAGIAALGIGAAQFNAVAPEAVAGMEAFVKAIADLAIYAPALLFFGVLVGVALIAIGAGALVAGIGAMSLGVGLMLMGIGLEMLAPGLQAIVPAFEQLANAVRDNADAMLPMAGLAVTLGLFGAAALIAGVGGLLLGAALMAIGVGFSLASMFAESGAESLMAALDMLTPLWKNAIQLGIAAAEIAAVGAALIVFGTGAILATVGGAGLIVVMLGMMMILPGFGNSVSRFADKFEPAANKMVAGLTKMAMGIGQSAVSITAALNMLSAAIRSGESNMISSFEGMGTRASQGMIKGLELGFMMASIVVMTNIQILVLSAINTLEGSVSGFGNAGRNIGGAIGRGLSSTTPMTMSLLKTMTTLMILYVTGAAKPMQAASRSMMAGYIRGINSQKSKIQKAGKEASRALVNGLNSGIKEAAGAGSRGGYRVGLELTNGLVRGVNAGRSNVIRSVRSMADSAVRAANDALEVRSPSRVFTWIGTMVALGAAAGIDKRTDAVVESTENMGLQAIRAAHGSLSGMSDVLEASGDFSPTIRPIMDLSEVRRGSEFIQSLMATKPIHASVTASMAKGHAEDLRQRDIEAAEAAKNRPADGVTFIQNNHSPKALTTTEIYRKTKGVVNKAKKVLTEEDQ